MIRSSSGDIGSGCWRHQCWTLVLVRWSLSIHSMWIYGLCDSHVSQMCHLTGQPSFLTWQFFLGVGGETFESQSVHAQTSHTWGVDTSEVKSQWLIKICSKQLWLTSNQNYRNVLHTWEDTFLGQHRVDVCLLTEMHLGSGETFQMAQYVCHHTDWLTEGGGTAVLVQWGIDHYAVPIPGVRHLVATAIQVMLASKPVKILGRSTYCPASLSSISICLPALEVVSQSDGGCLEWHACALEF
jgi:hypothetical protein